MDWWSAVHAAATVFLREHGLLAACTALFIEEAGVPLPILPGDVVMLAVGIQARRGLVPLWLALVALEVVTVLGASLLYFVSRRAGRGLIYRYGKFLHVTPERLAQAEVWVRRHGPLAVIGGRVFPGLRIATAIGCGVLDVPVWTYLPSLAAGAMLYILIYTLLGYYFGPAALLALERLHIPLEVVGSLVVLIVGVVWLAQARRGLPLTADEHAVVPAGPRRRILAGVTAGATATIGATLTMNALIPVIGDIATQVSGTIVATVGLRLPSAIARREHPAVLLAGVLLFIAGGVFWGAVYGRWAARPLRRSGLPDWLKGVLFTLGPFIVSLALLLPTLRLEAFGPRATRVLLTGDGLFHLAYAVILGLTFPIFLVRPARRRRHRYGGHHAPPTRTEPELSHVA
jgi:membrane protein DedA with SNARE-associated domain